MRTSRTTAQTLATVAGLLVMAACSSGTTTPAAGSSAPTSLAATPSSPSTTGTGGTTATPTGAATASTPSLPTARATPSLSRPTTTAGCSSARLGLAQVGAQGAAGSQIRTYALRNTGTSACSLYGFPGASFLTGDGRQVGLAASRQGSSGTGVLLAPGSSARFQVQLAYAGCPSGTPKGVTLRIYPPGDRGSLLAPWGLPVCQRPTVTAVHSG